MSSIYFEFGDFRLDPSKRVLCRGGESIPLAPRAFELLSALVRSGGRPLTKECLIRAVWKDVFVDETNFHVTLHTVRRALGESGRAPNYIVKTSGGYCFTGDVRETSQANGTRSDLVSERQSVEIEQVGADRPAEEPVKSDHGFMEHITHIVASCSLYAALYATAVPLEIAYQFDRFGATALKTGCLVLAAVIITSVTGLAFDHRLALHGKNAGVLLAIGIFLLSSALLFPVLCLVLPAFPITVSNLQAYPAQAAYLKDEAYFLILGIFFVVMPFHFVTMIEGEARDHKTVLAARLSIENKATIATTRIPHPRLWLLTALLVMLALISVTMTAHLIDNLRPAPYMNLFVLLVYLRGILYFGLGIECLLWYWNALNEVEARAKSGY
jgi:DNA-binding winged helix-turn-helix (wHTH) protein